MTGWSIALGMLCAVWLAQAALVFVHLAELRTLADLHPDAPPAWPRVSAIVPSRNQADELPHALGTRLAEDYPDLEVVVVDDRSSDATASVLATMAAQDVRLRPIRIEDLPARWLGKVHALARGADAATGEWLLVSDADIEIAPGTLRRAVAVCVADGLDFLTLVPEFRSRSGVVDVLLAVFTRAFSTFVSPAAVRNPHSAAAAGSGAFMLLRRSAYARTPGFEWLRMETADDMALGLMMKQSGARCELMNGRGSARVSIYDSLGEFHRGVEKNAGSLIGVPFAVTALLIALAACVELSPIVAIAFGVGAGVPWLVACGVGAAALATACTVAASTRNTGRVMPALAWPAGWLLVASGILRAAWLARRRGGVVWRDTFYPRADLLEGRRLKLL